MVLGDSHEDSKPYNAAVKYGLPLLPQHGIGFHDYLGSPLPPPTSQAVPQAGQYLAAEPSSRSEHFQYANIPKSVDNNGAPFSGISFIDARDRLASGRPSQPSLLIHGFEDPMRTEIHWSGVSNDVISRESQLKVNRAIRKIFEELAFSRVVSKGNSSLPIRPQDLDTQDSADDSRRASPTSGEAEKSKGAVQPFRFVSEKGNKRLAERRLSRTSSPSDGEDDCTSPFEIVETKQIRLDDHAAIRNYFKEVFVGIQQLAMKLILKEWIKEIEPKKQKNFPYKKEVRPEWWPSNTKYVEPDHVKIEDRVEVGLHIVSYVQDHEKFCGRGLNILEQVVKRQVLVFENEPKEKLAFRQRLMANLFTLARAQQAVKNDERDASDVIAIEIVKKFERPNKRRKKLAGSKRKRRKGDSVDKGYRNAALPEGGVKVEDRNPGLGLKMIRSQSMHDPRRHDRTLETHGWISPPPTHEHSMDNMCYAQQPPPSPPQLPTSQFSQPTHSSPSLQTSGQYSQPPPTSSSALHNSQHMQLQYAPQFHPVQSVDSRYSSYDGSVVEASTPSPMTPYPSSTTSAGSMHMMYPSSSQPVGLGFEASVNMGHGVMQGPGLVPENPYRSQMAMQHRPQTTTVYRAATDGDESLWTATPAAYLPPQQQGFPSTPFYG